MVARTFPVAQATLSPSAMLECIPGSKELTRMNQSFARQIGRLQGACTERCWRSGHTHWDGILDVFGTEREWSLQSMCSSEGGVVYRSQAKHARPAVAHSYGYICRGGIASSTGSCLDNVCPDRSTIAEVAASAAEAARPAGTRPATKEKTRMRGSAYSQGQVQY